MKHLKLFAALCCAAAVLAACDKTTGTANGHEYVDLGLPSGLKWATCNVGADAPEAYGDYFAWGETTPKETYSWKKYRYGTAYDQLTKYCNDASYGKNGFADGKTTLEAADDAATQNWGGAWRMPTNAEWTELRKQCDWTWTTLNGVNGYEVKSKTNGNGIFLPAAGYRYDGSLYNAGGYGYYWASSLGAGFPFSAWFVGFVSCRVDEGYDSCCGRSVRPVRP